MRDIVKRGSIRHPEFVGKALSRPVLANLAHMAAVSVDKPHSGIDSIARAFVAEGDGAVIKRAVNRVAEPAFFLQYHALFAAVQVDINQPALRLGEVECAELAPVGQRLPVAFFDFDTHHLAAIAIGDPGPVGHPLVIHLIHHLLLQRGQIHAAQLLVIFHVPQRPVVGGKETAKGVIARPVGELGGLLPGDIE